MSETTDRFMREAEVHAMTSLSRAQRWRLELKGQFPARIRLGGRTVVWSAREIGEWMQSRPRARYVPQGAVLGPQHSDDEDMPGAAPRPTARRPAKPRQPTAL
jgi:predicted DNA-binding transcriptional regulator AlpA